MKTIEKKEKLEKIRVDLDYCLAWRTNAYVEMKNDKFIVCTCGNESAEVMMRTVANLRLEHKIDFDVIFLNEGFFIGSNELANALVTEFGGIVGECNIAHDISYGIYKVMSHVWANVSTTLTYEKVAKVIFG